MWFYCSVSYLPLFNFLCIAICCDVFFFFFCNHKTHTHKQTKVYHRVFVQKSITKRFKTNKQADSLSSMSDAKHCTWYKNRITHLFNLRKSKSKCQMRMRIYIFGDACNKSTEPHVCTRLVVHVNTDRKKNFFCFFFIFFKAIK